MIMVPFIAFEASSNFGVRMDCEDEPWNSPALEGRMRRISERRAQDARDARRSGLEAHMIAARNLDPKLARK